MCARKINANAAPRRTGTEGSLPRPTSVGNVTGPKGAVSKNFLYINQHFSSTGLVGGKYISARTKEKKRLEFIFIIYFSFAGKSADFVAFEFVVARQLQKRYAIFCFVFGSCFAGKKELLQSFCRFRRLRVRCLSTFEPLSPDPYIIGRATVFCSCFIGT
jgi:hypothetical protein